MGQISMNSEVEYIPINMILPNPYQPRKHFNDSSLEELKNSIMTYGVLQPISVRKISEEKYELIAGERRLRASKLAGMEVIPAVVLKADEIDSAIIALIENLQREDLDFLEEAEGYQNLLHNYNFTQEELAQKIGKSQSTIANKIRLLKLSPEVLKIIKENNLTERHARALLRLHDDKIQLKVLKQVVKKKLNVKETEDLINRVLDSLENREKVEKKRKFIKALKDVRIYINTIKQAVNLMNKSGVKAVLNQVEGDDYVEFIVRISR
ncbi:chromosome partitioning protein, ParB family [Caldanaerobius fijiensis DSM 17918]|uniref:Chromosome partitioning protein, ParB family n=2 Tax=Caldanaerobius TaxID=862261 RepID=A0A1M5APQ3_9THEO|nr:chromosome partitioning protein, ParB family [Caldanaerobius fijiensis DSM 17918]